MYGPAYCNNWNPVAPNMMFCNPMFPYGTYTPALNTANSMAQNTVQASIQETCAGLKTANQQMANVNFSSLDIKYLENAYFIQTAFDRTINQFEKPKQRLTIYDLDRLIFPEDPIRDWVEKKTKEIDKKFAWADELMERMDI